MKKVLAFTLIAVGIYVASFYTVKIDISPRQAVACDSDNGCNGG